MVVAKWEKLETKGFASFVVSGSNLVVVHMMATGDLHGR
jgi:hypothetical protein